MNLACAILNVLEVSPRPIAAEVIAALVPQFFGKPVKPAVVLAECEIMEQTGDVFFQAHRDRGRLWTITKIGKARIS